MAEKKTARVSMASLKRSAEAHGMRVKTTTTSRGHEIRIMNGDKIVYKGTHSYDPRSKDRCMRRLSEKIAERRAEKVAENTRDLALCEC